jgi:hypothetical protein
MKTFIRVVEVWVPDAEGVLLVMGSAHYGAARRFGMSSREMCFGRGEGLPGAAWEAGHPIVLKQFEGSTFRRTAAAHADGLTCGIALPVFAGQLLKAVVLIFCGGDSATPDGDRAEQQAGAIELWRNEFGTHDLLLEDGHYGATSAVFEYISRRTAFRKGTGLPGMAWACGLPVFMDDLGKGGRFLRADSAQKVGINRGFAVPCACAGADAYVMAFLSALATPIVRRLEIWLPGPDGAPLRRREGFCETAGVLDGGSDSAPPALARALATAVPQVAAASATQALAIVALPVLAAGEVVAVMAWHL